MGTYNIYSYNNAADDDEPIIVVELNEDDTEILNVTSADPEQQEEDEGSLLEYVEKGASPKEAMTLYAGSYGQVWAEGADRTSGTDEEAVVSASENGAETFEPPTGADRVFSGDIMALVDEDGVVASLFKADEKGNASVRVDKKWKPISNLSVIEDLSFVGVNENSVDFYDKHQSDGNLVPIKFYTPSADGPYWTEPVEFDESGDTTGDAAEEPLAASVMLDTAEDLDAAIAAAAQNQDLRWYVERRVAALGLEADLPWLEG